MVGTSLVPVTWRLLRVQAASGIHLVDKLTSSFFTAVRIDSPTNPTRCSSRTSNNRVRPDSYVYPARLYRLYSNQHPYWQCCTYYVLCRYAEEATGQPGQGDSKCESEGPPLANSAQRSRVLQVETVHTYGDIVTILRVGIWARNPISIGCCTGECTSQMVPDQDRAVT